MFQLSGLYFWVQDLASPTNRKKILRHDPALFAKGLRAFGVCEMRLQDLGFKVQGCGVLRV